MRMFHRCSEVPYRDAKGNGYEIEYMDNGFWKFRIIGAVEPPKKIEIVCKYCFMCGEALDNND
jgi:hypothetical protein